MGGLSPQAPVAEPLSEQVLDESSGRSGETDTNWTVYSMNVARGSLDEEPDLDDPRMSVGWSSNATAALRESDSVPWMSMTEQQPFMWSGAYVVKDDQS